MIDLDPMVTFEAYRVQSICLLFVSWQSHHFLDIGNYILTLKIKKKGQGHVENRPKSNQVIYKVRANNPAKK